MHTKRIIPCLDVRNGKVVKGINFVGIKEVGNPVELGEYYYKQGAIFFWRYSRNLLFSNWCSCFDCVILSGYIKVW